MKRNYFWANMIRGIGLCLILCPMAMCFAFAWYHLYWFLYLVIIGVAAYLAGKVYVMEFDNRRVSSAVYNLTAIASAALTVVPTYYADQLPYYLPNMDLYSIAGAVFLILSIFLRPPVKKASQSYVHVTGIELQAVLDKNSKGITVHPTLLDKLDAKEDDPLEVVGGYMGSRYTTGKLSVGAVTLDADKVYLSEAHFKALSLSSGATVKVCYYRPAQTSDSVEEAVRLAISYNNDVP